MFDQERLIEQILRGLVEEEERAHMENSNIYNNKNNSSILKNTKTEKNHTTTLDSKIPVEKHDGDIIELTLDGGKKVYTLFLKKNYIPFSAKDAKDISVSRKASVTSIYEYPMSKINDAFWDGKANIKDYGTLIWKRELTDKEKFNNKLDDIFYEWIKRYKNSNIDNTNPEEILKSIIEKYKY